MCCTTQQNTLPLSWSVGICKPRNRTIVVFAVERTAEMTEKEWNSHNLYRVSHSRIRMRLIFPLWACYRLGLMPRSSTWESATDILLTISSEPSFNEQSLLLVQPTSHFRIVSKKKQFTVRLPRRKHSGYTILCISQNFFLLLLSMLSSVISCHWPWIWITEQSTLP
jgi:hypothetical protein